MDIAVVALTFLGWAGLTIGLFGFDTPEFLRGKRTQRSTAIYVASAFPFCAAALIQFVRAENTWPFLAGIALALFMAATSALSYRLAQKRRATTTR